jgi:hypothetical protein
MTLYRREDGCHVSDYPRLLGTCRDNRHVRAYEHSDGTIRVEPMIVAPPYLHPRTEQMDIDDARRWEWMLSSLSQNQRRSWLDYGCHSGSWVESHGGVGFDPARGDKKIPPGPFTVITMFHVLEHLEAPISVLRRLRKFAYPGGCDEPARLIVEVPHARDWLIHNSEAFRKHTFRSDHYVLHTEWSLQETLWRGGWHPVQTEFVQRYDRANHERWMGHALGPVHCMELETTCETDTLIVIARPRDD